MEDGAVEPRWVLWDADGRGDTPGGRGEVGRWPG